MYCGFKVIFVNLLENYIFYLIIFIILKIVKRLISISSNLYYIDFVYCESTETVCFQNWDSHTVIISYLLFTLSWFQHSEICSSSICCYFAGSWFDFYSAYLPSGTEQSVRIGLRIWWTTRGVPNVLEANAPINTVSSTIRIPTWNIKTTSILVPVSNVYQCKSCFLNI